MQGNTLKGPTEAQAGVSEDNQWGSKLLQDVAQRVFGVSASSERVWVKVGVTQMVAITQSMLL